MYRFLFVLAVVAFWLLGGLAANAQPQDLELQEQLHKYGVFLSPNPLDGMGLLATISSDKLDSGMAVKLLRRVKNLTEIGLHLGEGKLTADHLKLIKDLPAVKRLEVHAYQLSDQDIKTIATLKHLEGLTLESAEFTDVHLRALQTMTGLQFVSLACVEVSPKAVAELKIALVLVKSFHVERFAIRLLPSQKISPNDDLLTKLRKEKFNAALVGIRSYHTLIRGGFEHATYSSREFLDLAHHLKHAAMDLNEPVLKMNVIDGLVELWKRADREAIHLMESGRLRRHQHQIIRCNLLDAQILQVQLRKQMDKK